MGSPSTDTRTTGIKRPLWHQHAWLLLLSILFSLGSASANAQELGARVHIPTAAVQPCGATLAFGDAMTCAISVPAEVDTITLSAQAGDVVLVRVGIAAGDMTPLARILAPGGSKLCEAGDAYAQGVEISRCAKCLDERIDT